jgi:PKHD-type hydroxylase
MTPFRFREDALPEALCDDLIARAGAAQRTDAALVGRNLSPDLRRADLVWLDDLADSAPLMDRLIRLTADLNRDGMGADLTDFAESAQIARYGAERQGHFGWHSDIGRSGLAGRRKLTLVVQLSDPAAYDGGMLELWPDATVTAAPRARGTAVLFPSFVLHRVTPVTRGTRWSLTLWAHGPAWR